MKVALALLVLIGLLTAWTFWRRVQRKRFISDAPLPHSLRARLQAEHPEWSGGQRERVLGGLRQFFRACAHANGAFVAMPSKAVDAAWHAFILDTRAYAQFCRLAFGKLLHHTPAEALPAGTAPQRLREGLHRAWVGACRDEGMDPRRTGTLPLLFALDAELGIPGGYRYVPDCRLLGADRGDTHCASDLSSCSGSTGGASDDGGGSGDGGGCGGGCGGGD